MVAAVACLWTCATLTEVSVLILIPKFRRAQDMTLLDQVGDQEEERHTILYQVIGDRRGVGEEALVVCQVPLRIHSKDLVVTISYNVEALRPLCSNRLNADALEAILPRLRPTFLLIPCHLCLCEHRWGSSLPAGALDRMIQPVFRCLLTCTHSCWE